MNHCLQDFINKELKDAGRRTAFPEREAKKRRKLKCDNLGRPFEGQVQSVVCGEGEGPWSKQDEWEEPSAKGGKQ